MQWRLESCVCKSWRGGWHISPYNKRDSKCTKDRSRNKDLIQTKCGNSRKGYAFSPYWRQKSAVQRWQINLPSISTYRAVRQSVGITTTSQLPASWPLASQKDNEIRDAWKRYPQYHPVIHPILQILQNKQETQPEVWSCTTEAGHNDSLESIMCRSHRAIHS